MFQENSIETCILSRVKQITGPGWMHETSAGPGALGGPGGSGWGGRWEGGSGWGRHVNPRPFHFNVWQNSLQIIIKKRHRTILLITMKLSCSASLCSPWSPIPCQLLIWYPLFNFAISSILYEKNNTVCKLPSLYWFYLTQFLEIHPSYCINCFLFSCEFSMVYLSICLLKDNWVIYRVFFYLLLKMKFPKCVIYT